MSDVLKFPRPWPLTADGLRDRLVLTAVAGIQFLSGLLVALPLGLLVVVGVVLIPVVGLGVAVLFAVLPLLGAWGSRSRRVLAKLLGRPIPGEYQVPQAPGIRNRLDIWVHDPVRWSDFGHVAFSAAAGALLSGLVVAAFGGPFSLLLLALTQGGWLRTPAFIVNAAIVAALWWLLTPWLVRIRLDADAAILGERRTELLERRIDQVTRTRSETLDHSAAEIRRIERDLHDGAQARLVALGMHLGLAEELAVSDPTRAAELVGAARDATQATLEELRAIIRAIHPPLLADRGLGGALDALAQEFSLPVTVTTELDGLLPPPIESAAYFAVTECLTNITKHAAASRAWVVLRDVGGQLHVIVGDDGRGGADASRGSGLAGLARRLAAFDGTMEIISPVGGGTRVRMEIPCEPSSPRTTPS